MGGVRKSLGGVQLFASAWGVGLVGADRSKLERKKLCIILCPVYLRIVLNKLYSILSSLNKPASEVVICACNLGIDREAFKLFEIYTSC